MNYKNIKSDNISIGKNSVIEPTATIRGINGNAKNIIIGDNCYVGHNVQIILDEFSIGDYSKIHHNCNIHGYKPCHIGHNAWIGQYTIVDSIGGVTIGNNCGIGAHSQMWSHIKYGDVLEGCRFLSENSLVVGDDVWFVGHCIVSPINAANKSMAIAGAVITKNMKYNTIYAGAPAKSISDKIGFQFREVSLSEKIAKLNEFLEKANVNSKNIKVVGSIDEISFDDNVTYFNVKDRRYTKKRNQDEIDFIKYLLPEKAKFVPY
jgi:acetyltransferase-like isoleucine patch superfamily enzyme